MNYVDGGNANISGPTTLSSGRKNMGQKNDLELKPQPNLTTAQVAIFEKALTDADGPAAVARLLRSRLNVENAHLKFLIANGGAAKLREFYYEVLKFDLLYRTNTSAFISEEAYQGIAQTRPGALADPNQAEHGVKHRSSLTSVITDSFNEAVAILRDNGIDPSEASLFDLGCGVGKAICIGTSNNGQFRSKDSGQRNFPFKKAIGVDYFRDVLDIAKQNIKSSALKINGDRDVRFEFADAAEFRGFNGVNVVYMYNPFDAAIMERVEHNLRTYAGKTIVIYNKPLHADIFKNNDWRTESEHTHDDPDNQVTIFSRGIFSEKEKPAVEAKEKPAADEATSPAAP